MENFTTIKGNLFDTRMTKSHHFNEPKAIFVMDKDGNIYASLEHTRGEFHHSSFLGGEAVASAGEISVKKGVANTTTLQSGHYRPNITHEDQLIDRFRRSGIDTEKIKREQGF